MSALASVWMEKCQECRTWTSKSCCNILCSWHVAAQRKSSFRGSTFWETTCFFFFLQKTNQKRSQTLASPFIKVVQHKEFLVLLMASGYIVSSVRALGGGVFLLASRPLVSAWESIWNREGFRIWPVLFTLYFFFALPCIISCLRLVWTAVAGVREVAGPDTFRESGALYATQTQIKLGKKKKCQGKKCSIMQMKWKLWSFFTFMSVCIQYEWMVASTPVHGECRGFKGQTQWCREEYHFDETWPCWDAKTTFNKAAKKHNTYNNSDASTSAVKTTINN